MAEIKWIKLTIDMFDNRKIKHLRRLPDGNNIVLIWVMLLTMAGRCNSNGMIFLTENIPYNSKMLADELNFEENTVKLALEALEQFEMIVTDGDFFSIAGWGEYQNLEGMEKIREQNRIRKQRQREKEKLLLPVGHVKSRDNHATDIEEDKEQEKEQYKKKILKEKIDFQQIVLLFNDICKSLPSVKVLSEARKDELAARLETYSIDDLKTLFEKAEASDFLKGKNDSGWVASFDWLIREKNMPKVIEGNYDNKPKQKKNRKYDFDALERMAFDKVNAVQVKGNPELEKEAEDLKKMLQETYKKGVTSDA